MWNSIVDFVAQMTSIDMILMAVSALLGLFLGWIIWGGQRQHINELEDALAVTRAHVRTVTLEDEDAPQEQGEVHEEIHKNDVQGHDDTDQDDTNQDQADDGEELADRDDEPVPQKESSTELTSDLSKGLSGQDSAVSLPPDEADVKLPRLRITERNQDQLNALSEELDKIRALIRMPVDVDMMKEHLDQSDEAVKKVNGRVELIKRALEKAKQVE